MTSAPIFLYLSLRYNRSSESIFSDADADIAEETHIIPIYDCYYTDAPQGKKGDEYCHYYIRNYVNKDAYSGNSSFADMIDPNLKVCCRNGEIFFSDSSDKFFRRFEGVLQLRRFSTNGRSAVIGTLEEMNITM